MRYEIYLNGVWVEQKPTENGQHFRLYDDAGGMLESYWNEPTTEASKTKLTRLSFRNRFTFAEKVAIETAAETDAVVRVLLKDQSEATYIDLTRVDTQQGTMLLVQKGLITAERAAEILSLVIRPDEEFRG